MRRRSEPHSFFENLNAGKVRLEVAFENIERGPQCASLERKLCQIETASHKNEWLALPGLQPPKASGMDRKALLRDFASAGQHIVQSDAHISKQEAVIAKLDRDGHNTSVARALLNTMRDTRVLHLQHRVRILKELAR